MGVCVKILTILKKIPQPPPRKKKSPIVAKELNQPMTSLTTFLLGNFFFNLKQLSKFEWVFLFFFSHTNLTFDKKTQKKAKRREKIRNKWTRPSKQKKLCWRNKSREKKKNFSPHSQIAFFFLVTNDNK